MQQSHSNLRNAQRREHKDEEGLATVARPCCSMLLLGEASYLDDLMAVTDRLRVEAQLQV